MSARCHFRDCQAPATQVAQLASVATLPEGMPESLEAEAIRARRENAENQLTYMAQAQGLSPADIDTFPPRFQHAAPERSVLFAMRIPVCADHDLSPRARNKARARASEAHQ